MDDDLKDLKKDIAKAVQKKNVVTTGVFSYNPDEVVKCSYVLVQDHYIWVKLCEVAEELHTTPTMLNFLLQEKFLLALGKIKPDYRLTNPATPSEPIVVKVSDLDETEDFFGLGENWLLKSNKDKAKKRNQEEDEEDEDDPLGTGL